MSSFDPVVFSRALGRVADEVQRWQQRLRVEPSPDDSPFLFERDVANGTQFQLIAEELRSDDPLRAPLLRWVHFLLEQRVNRLWYTRVCQLRYAEQYAVQEPQRGRFTWNHVAQQLLSGPRRLLWAKTLGELPAEQSAAQRTLWQRKVEIAERLKLPTPFAYSAVLDKTETPNPELSLAERVLSESAPYAAEFQAVRGAHWLDTLLAPLAHVEFPSRISEHKLAEWFRGGRLLEAVPLRSWALPSALGPASYMRALSELGAEFRHALSSDTQPYVVRHDPYGLDAQRFAMLFALLLVNPPFGERNLAVGVARRRDVARAFGMVLLFELRQRAAAVLLSRAAFDGSKSLSEMHERVTEQLFGVPLSSSLAGCLPRLREDAESRLVGGLLGLEFNDALITQHDEDWFRNPRAVEHVRSLAALPPQVSATLEQAEAAWSRWHQRLPDFIG
jgi:hypothetical protein